MALHPQVIALLQQIAALGAPPLTEQTPVEVRKRPRLPVTPEPISYTQDITIPTLAGDLPIRIYRPEGGEQFPVLVYFHGGGWVFNNVDTHDHTCRSLANQARCLVVSVDYRLAPEHKFPAAVEDAYAATCWAAEHIKSFQGDPERIAVGGDSAGGNLAAVVAQLSKQYGKPALCCQLLIYPATDHSFDTPSYSENAEGYGLTRESMVWFWNHYLPDAASGADPKASPLRTSDLSGLAPAFVITAEYDPLRDEVEAYAARMKDAGVVVKLRRYAGMNHAFFVNAPFIDTGKGAVQDAAHFLSDVFSSKAGV